MLEKVRSLLGRMNLRTQSVPQQHQTETSHSAPRVKKEAKPDYVDQIVNATEHNPDIEIVRKALCEQLKKGIHIELSSGFPVIVKLVKYYDKIDEMTEIMVIAKSTSGQDLGYVTAFKKDGETVATGIRRTHTNDAPEEVKKVGMIAICASLLFQVLLEDGVDTAVSSIMQTNADSFSSSLKTQDIFTKNYYRSAITDMKDDRSLHTKLIQMTTYLREPVLSQPQHFDAETARLA